MKHLKILLSALILLTSIQTTALAQEMDLMKAKQMGLVGEQLDGMIGIVKPPGSPKIIALKKKVNEYRLNYYKKLAQESGKSTSQVRLEFGRNLTAASGPGFYVKDQTGNWMLK